MDRGVRAEGRTRGDDSGDTLIEVLMSLVIMSITVVALLGAFSTALSASAVHRNLAVTDTVLRSVSESVYSAFQQTNPAIFASCPTATASYYSSALASALEAPYPYTTTYSASITAVMYWGGSDFNLTPSTCTSGTAAPQQLTLVVTGPNGASESLDFVIAGSGQIVVAPSVQLDAPSISALSAPTGTSGELTVSFNGSANAPAGQTYTVVACTDPAMTIDCLATGHFKSGSSIFGLIAGTVYYVTVSADPSTGYLRATSAVSSPTMSSGQSARPTVTSVLSSSSLAGALVVTFAPPTGAASTQTYSATTCLDSSMSLGCVTQGLFTSGSQVTGLSPGAAYYATVSADATTSTPVVVSAVYAPAVAATVQLSAPSYLSGTPSATASGVFNASFTGSANAPVSQIYTVSTCTNSAMTSGCVTQGSFTSGSQVTGLTAGATYYFTISAVASSGYLRATSSVAGGVMASLTLAAPSITSTSSPSSGAGVVNFTGSSNAPPAQTYKVTLCANSSMTLNCLSNNPYVSGAAITGLTSKTFYYVTITADPSPGYITSTSSVKSLNVS